MADRSPEQILLDEYERLTRGHAGAQAPDLLTGIGTPAGGGAAAGTRTSSPPPTQLLSTLAASQPVSARTGSTMPSSRQVNQGYTLPVPEASASALPSGNTQSTLGEIGSTALKVFTSGLGLMPLVTGLAGLFGGGEAAPPPLLPYAMPRPVSIHAANVQGNGSLQPADYSQQGSPRAFGEAAAGAQPAESRGAAPGWPGAMADATSAVAPAAPSFVGTHAGSPQIVVNVSAMDSQSFLDRSADIAQAVRQAMLNMHSLNDVVSEL